MDSNKYTKEYLVNCDIFELLEYEKDNKVDKEIWKLRAFKCWFKNIPDFKCVCISNEIWKKQTELRKKYMELFTDPNSLELRKSYNLTKGQFFVPNFEGETMAQLCDRQVNKIKELYPNDLLCKDISRLLDELKIRRVQAPLEKILFVPLIYNDRIDRIKITSHININKLPTGTLVGIYTDEIGSLDPDYSKPPIKFLRVITKWVDEVKEKELKFENNIDSFFNKRASELFITKEEFINLYNFPFMKNKLI